MLRLTRFLIAASVAAALGGCVVAPLDPPRGYVGVGVDVGTPYVQERGYYGPYYGSQYRYYRHHRPWRHRW